MTTFNLIPAADLEVDQPTFKASKWRANTGHRGRFTEYSECYELIGGRWEGFVSVREGKSKDRLPKSITKLLCSA